MNKVKLIQKIQKATTVRMEPRGYGDNPEEMKETRSGNIYLTQEEVNCVIGMRKCTSVSMGVNLGGYDDECFDENGKATKHYPHSNHVHIRLGKKQAKRMINAITGPKLIQVLVIGDYADDSDKFCICL
tara:strand:- start:303 stop:689 length:387 start_codon:yes stop_codon:yes gene_type:complete